MHSKTHMLATDLDNTLVGMPEELEELTILLKQETGGVSLVYVTGRHADSVKELMAAEHLPIPDLVISDVGTAIWHMPDWKEDSAWQEKMTADWNPDSVKTCAGRFPSLQLQNLPDDRRVSFTTEGDTAAVRQFRQALEKQAIPHEFIFSSNRDVDVLPKGAGKGNALDYVIRTYARPDVRLLVAGDSGNDIDMLDREWPSVIVGNAHPELQAISDRQTLYRADRHCAGGICDAWQYFYGSANSTEYKPKKLSGKS
ncbi:HAD-IIB family hydrolase [Sporosarcina trichiuri]|uniref:HAD-IIB family hydrolase n=1 Tax=Sporosarcina trichiuri TaxID=3056445 RepID=UPI0025B4AFED|nr:HAD-IIB family hydrolase [Sporosarcina sp. 0.2-SM1T-5]WJY27380.1 HAD-IIB family hydrolase [Sporosarcina sp. 0.2-SM1T-5]